MENNGTFFVNFFKEWKDEDAYDLGFFVKQGIPYNSAQYYLRIETYKGTLCCVKVKNKTYYMKRRWYENFKIFEKLDYVKVI